MYECRQAMFDQQFIRCSTDSKLTTTTTIGGKLGEGLGTRLLHTFPPYSFDRLQFQHTVIEVGRPGNEATPRQVL